MLQAHAASFVRLIPAARHSSASVPSRLPRSSRSYGRFCEIPDKYAHCCHRASCADFARWPVSQYLVVALVLLPAVVGQYSAIVCSEASQHTCGLTSSGGVRCWGWNSYGQLGNGSAGGQLNSPPTTDVLVNARAITTGFQHTCAVTVSGGVRCWGWNGDGELGNGGTTQLNSPPGTDVLTNVSSISAGAYSTCALMAWGGVRCWGSNMWGQLGNGGTTQLNSPSATDALSNVSAIACGWAQTCAVMTWAGLRCWGGNNFGELGTGNTAQLTSPPGSDTLANVSAVATGHQFTCALMTWGGVKCWGDNLGGQLGNGNLSVSALYSPPAADILTNVSAIACGEYHTCALMSWGGVRCWGSNNYGQLGIGVANSTLLSWHLPQQMFSLM